MPRKNQLPEENELQEKKPLTAAQIQYMREMVKALKDYRADVEKNDIYQQAVPGFDLKMQLDAQINKARRMTTDTTQEDYEEWLQRLNGLSKSLRSIQEKVEAYIAGRYEEKADELEDAEPIGMENRMALILAKQKEKEELTPLEQELAPIAAEYEKVQDFIQATERFHMVSGFLSAPPADVAHKMEVHEEEEEEENAEQEEEEYGEQEEMDAPDDIEPDEYPLQALDAFVTELQGLESRWGSHHDQWKAMKEALKQAKELAGHLPEDPSEANEKMLSAMNLLQQTAMNYVVYKAAKNPSGKDLQRQMMAERMVSFAARQVMRLEPQVEEADKAGYISKAKFDTLLENARAKNEDIGADHPLRGQLAHMRGLYDALFAGDVQPDSDNYRELERQLDIFSNPAKNREYRNMVDNNDQHNWATFQNGLRDITSLARKCIEEQSARNDYSEAAIRRKDALYQLGSYTSHLHGAHLESIRADNQAAFRQRVARCRAELVPHVNTGDGRFRNIENLYTIYAGYLYERALRNGGKTPEDKEIIRSVEEKGHFYATEAYSYARKLTDADKKDPNSVTAQWFYQMSDKAMKHTMQAMKDENQAAALCEMIASGVTPEAYQAKIDEERQKLTPEERNVLEFRDVIDDKRYQLHVGVASYTKENFKDDADSIILNCYRVAVAGLFEAAASRDAQGKANDKDREILDAVRSGHGLEYAITLKNQGLHSLNDVMADWFGAGHITYETAKAMTSPEGAARILDKISQGISPEISEAKRAANAQAFLQEANDEPRVLDNTLMQMTKTGRNLDVKEEDFAKQSHTISASCYKIYVGALYSAASQRARDGAATEEDKKLIQAVENGKAKLYIENLMRKDSENPGSITAQWFSEDKITLIVANDLTNGKKRTQEIFDAVTKGKLPAEEKQESSLKNIRRIAADARGDLKKDLERGYDARSEKHSKCCYKIYTAYLYEKAMASVEKTEQEKALIKAVESDKFDAYATDMMENDQMHPESTTAKLFLENKLTDKTLAAMSGEEESNALCEKTFNAKAKKEIRDGNVAAFRRSAEDARDRMCSAVLQKGKELQACLKEARLRGKDCSKEIFTAYVCDLYDSLPASRKKWTQEQKFVANQVEKGNGHKLVELMQEDKILCTLLDFQNIGKENFENALRKGKLAELAKDTAILPLVRLGMNKNLSDPDMIKAQNMEPVPEKMVHISELSYTVYAAARYIAAKQMHVPTKGSQAIVDAVERGGLDKYADALKQDPKAQDLFEPGNLNMATVKALYSVEGRKELTRDITAGEPALQKKDAKQKSEPAKADGMNMGK